MKKESAARVMNVRNPRTGEHDYVLRIGSTEALGATAARVRSAQPAWLASGVGARIDVLRRWQQSLNEWRERIVAALAVDTGRKLLAEQEFEGLQRSIDRWCGLAPELLTEKSAAALAMPDVEIHQHVDPYPVVGAISPWNFPLLLSFIDVTPALLAGSAAIIKPSEVTPRFAEPVIESIRAVTELAAVLAVAPGDGQTGAALISEVDVVAFTGSVATGRKVAEAAAREFIPAFLELGGKDPVIVLAGSDVERATTAILRASIAATGQACQSIERIYVARELHDEFAEVLARKASAAKLSRENPGQGIVGPLIFDRQAEIISRHLEDAIAKGAKILVGGLVENVNGAFWIAPTVVTNVDHSMQLMTEETFGPIMPIMAFGTVDEAVALANDTVFGLSAAVFGPDDEVALRVAARLNAGGVSVNDAGMTTMLFETEKSAYGFSGMGPSRVGASGLTRFLRRKSLYVNRGDVFPIEFFRERDQE